MSGHVHFREICVDIALIIRDNVRWLFFFLGIIAAQAALTPSSAWITKSVIDTSKQDGATIESIVFQYGPLWLLIMAVLVVLKFGEKILNKLVQLRIIINLQRIYLDRESKEHAGNDASHILYGAEVGKKGVEVVYKDSWKILTEVSAVLVWQLSLGPEWVPLMLMSVIPSMCFVWFMGPYIQKTSLGILNLQSALAGHTKRILKDKFVANQEQFYKQSLKFEVFKWASEEAMDILMWIILALLVTSAWFFDLPIIPEQLELGSIAAAIINLKLLAKPLGDVGKVYTKWCEAFPALVNIFQPGSGTFEKNMGKGEKAV